MRFRCRSLSGMKWTAHSRRMVPISLSQKAFAFGARTGDLRTRRPNPFRNLSTVLYTYSTCFGNSYRSQSRIQGRKGTIENYGGEGASLFLVTREGGPQEFDPADNARPRYTAPPGMGPEADGAEIVRVAGAPTPDSLGPNDDDVNHLMNWLNAMRDRREPNANVDHGFSHSIVCIMAAQSYWSGKKLWWDPSAEEIIDHPPAPHA